MTSLTPQNPETAATAASTNSAASAPQGAAIVGLGVGVGPGPEVMAASTIDGDKVISSDGEHVGKIAAIMLDVRGGRIAYAVVSSGGFLGMGDTLHAIPWSALTLDTDDRCFVLDASAERIKSTPGQRQPIGTIQTIGAPQTIRSKAKRPRRLYRTRAPFVHRNCSQACGQPERD